MYISGNFVKVWENLCKFQESFRKILGEGKFIPLNLKGLATPMFTLFKCGMHLNACTCHVHNPLKIPCHISTTTRPIMLNTQIWNPPAYGFALVKSAMHSYVRTCTTCPPPKKKKSLAIHRRRLGPTHGIVSYGDIVWRYHRIWYRMTTIRPMVCA